MKTTQIPEQQLSTLVFPSYEITYERITDQLTKVFSPVELKEYLNLYEKAQEKPKEIQKSVEGLLNKHKKSAEIYNLLGYIYVRLKKIRKAEKLIQENYKENPDNLFAKINYADQCLRKGKADLVPTIFDHQTDLKKLYPSRKNFHFSEILGFCTLMGYYYLKKGDREKAKDYCAYAKLVDPEDQILKHLTQKIAKKTFLEHLISRLKKK